jgi:UDP-N-acetylmuramoyl-L-alanyl-D-glutamate--2,6-diaminopimelate ligase
MDEIAAGMPTGSQVLREVDRERAIERALEAAGTDDLVLITGKGHERTQEAGGQRVPFSDVAIVRRSVKKAP